MNRAWQGGVWRITILFAALIAFPAAAQNRGEGVPLNAADAEILLQSTAVTWGQAARFILAAASSNDRANGDGNVIGDAIGDASGEAAFNRTAALMKLPGGAEAHGAVTLGGVSLIIMKAFGLSGGMYELYPSPRYAYRELVFLGVIQGRGDPDMRLSGERFLRILGRTLDYTGGGQR